MLVKTKTQKVHILEEANISLPHTTIFPLLANYKQKLTDL